MRFGIALTLVIGLLSGCVNSSTLKVYSGKNASIIKIDDGGLANVLSVFWCAVTGLDGISVKRDTLER